MARLAPVLGDTERSRLLRHLAEQAIEAARGAGANPSVITADAEVSAWAASTGSSVVIDPGGGLDSAASAGVAAAAPHPWVVVHGDLPWVTAADLGAMLEAIAYRPVLAPSKDGGTSAVASAQPWFPFRYGPGSFHRHLAVLRGRATVVVRPGLAIDIDRPTDLTAWSKIHRT
jgi:2-phospho-L-lactate/phosphoenolpyruvate guanylyltransferase